MKLVSLVAVALLAAATVVVPEPDPPLPEPSLPQAPAPYAVCPTAEAARRQTSLDMAGGTAGDLNAQVFSAGEVVGSTTIDYPEAGPALLDVSDITGLARSPVLVALHDAAVGVEAILSGVGSGASACGPGSPATMVLAGGSTAEGETLTLLLANPFAGTATMSIGAASEVGTESNTDLERVVVPPRSLVALDLSGLLPGRQILSSWVTPIEGRVVAGITQEGSGDVAASQGSEANVDWYVPVPVLEGTSRSLVIAAPGTAEVPLQLDVYDSQGLFEAAYEEVVPARGQLVVQVADLVEGPGVLRVVAAGPVAAGLRIAGEGVRALIPGAPAPATTWLIPGAGRASPATVYVFNPGEVDVTAQILEPGGSAVETVEVPAGTMVTTSIPSSRGVRIEGDGEVVVSWLSQVEDGVAGDVGQVAG